MLKELLNQTRAQKIKPIPAGFLTSKAWAAKEGMSERRTETILLTLSAPDGPLEKKKFPTVTADGSIRHIYHYRKK